METRLTVVGLFAGVGAFSLGFLKANEDAAKFRFDLRLLVDSDPVDGHRHIGGGHQRDRPVEHLTKPEQSASRAWFRRAEVLSPAPVNHRRKRSAWSRARLTLRRFRECPAQAFVNPFLFSVSALGPLPP